VLVHNGSLFLHTQLPEHILHGRMYITFKYYPSVIEVKLTSFESCIINIIIMVDAKICFQTSLPLFRKSDFIQIV